MFNSGLWWLRRNGEEESELGIQTTTYYLLAKHDKVK
jgi:hypothetical protein